MTRDEAITKYIMPALKRTWNDNVCTEIQEALEQEPYRDMNEIREIMSCDADAETKCKMISDILTAPPHYFKKPCGDAISREATLKPYKGLNDEDTISVWLIRKNIEQQPSVNPQEPKTEQFAKWVATEIFDEMWEYNKDAFAELACRKLAKLGIVRAKGGEWELVEPKEWKADTIIYDEFVGMGNEYNSIGCDECEVTKSQESMREFTREEAKAYSNALDKMYRPTGFNVFDDPCEDTISRQAVLDYIYNDLGLGDEENGRDVEKLMELQSSYKYVKSLPPVKPQERIGHWINSNIPNEKYVCSECGGACWYYDYRAKVAKSKFCPNCGAEMESEEKEPMYYPQVDGITPTVVAERSDKE